MAIETYAELITAVENWLDNSDLGDRSDDFVSLAEADIRSRQDWWERLYSLDDNSGDPLTITAQGQELPTTVREITAIWPEDSLNKDAFNMVTAVGWRRLAQTNLDAAGLPSQVYISYDMERQRGPVLYFWPAPSADMDVDFTYIKDVAPLSTAVNGLFLRHPDLYLYGALLHSAPFLRDPERIAEWQQFYEAAVNRANKELQRSKNAGSPKRPTLPKGRVF